VMLTLFSLVVALLHANVTNEHFREAFLFGMFFLAMACGQALWGALFILRPSRRLIAIAAVGNVMIITVWLASRTTGLPFGPTPWRAEPIGAIDVVCTFIETIICVTAVKLLVRTNDDVPHADAQTLLDAPTSAPSSAVRALQKRSATDPQACGGARRTQHYSFAPRVRP